MSRHGHGKADHASRNAAVRQKGTCQNEERDRHDLELFHAGEELQRHRIDRDIGDEEEHGQNRQAERNGYRRACQHEEQEQAKDESRRHRGGSVVVSAVVVSGV